MQAVIKIKLSGTKASQLQGVILGKTHATCFVFLLSLSPLISAAELIGRVVGVTDGDTLTVIDQEKRTHKIRLTGIDAPEKRQAFGQRSKQGLSDAVFDHTVTVDWSKRDRYGRLIGKILLHNGADVNLRQIELGLAWHYKAYEQEQVSQDRQAYAMAERQARQIRAGLWSDPQPTPPWEYRRRR